MISQSMDYYLSAFPAFPIHSLILQVTYVVSQRCPTRAVGASPGGLRSLYLSDVQRRGKTDRCVPRYPWHASTCASFRVGIGNRYRPFTVLSISAKSGIVQALGVGAVKQQYFGNICLNYICMSIF